MYGLSPTMHQITPHATHQRSRAGVTRQHVREQRAVQQLVDHVPVHHLAARPPDNAQRLPGRVLHCNIKLGLCIHIRLETH